MNPLAETREGKLVAADAKLGFDDNAHFRQEELFSMRDESQEDPRSAPALLPSLRCRPSSLFRCPSCLPPSKHSVLDFEGKQQQIPRNGVVRTLLTVSGLLSVPLSLPLSHVESPLLQPLPRDSLLFAVWVSNRRQCAL